VFLLLPARPALPGKGTRTSPRPVSRLSRVASAIHWRRIFALLSHLNAVYWPFVPPVLKNWLGLTVMHALFRISEDAAAAIAETVTQVPCTPPCASPYLPLSLGDFWGHRWNRYAGQLLKDIVYDPVVDGRFGSGLGLGFGLVQDKERVPERTGRGDEDLDRGHDEPDKKKKKKDEEEEEEDRHHGPLRGRRFAGKNETRMKMKKKAIATLVTFAVSGLIHMVCLASLVGFIPWAWLPFFLSHGVGIIGERVFFGKWVARRAEHVGVVERVLRALYVYAVCVVLADVWKWWWWLEASGVEAVFMGGCPGTWLRHGQWEAMCAAVTAPTIVVDGVTWPWYTRTP
jgi:hypothetical protein